VDWKTITALFVGALGKELVHGVFRKLKRSREPLFLNGDKDEVLDAITFLHKRTRELSKDLIEMREDVRVIRRKLDDIEPPTPPAAEAQSA
jgi:hypothetical protein